LFEQVAPWGTALNVDGQPGAGVVEQLSLGAPMLETAGLTTCHCDCMQVATMSQLCTGLDPYSHSRPSVMHGPPLTSAPTEGHDGLSPLSPPLLPLLLLPPLLLPLPLPLLLLPLPLLLAPLELLPPPLVPPPLVLPPLLAPLLPLVAPLLAPPPLPLPPPPPSVSPVEKVAPPHAIGSPKRGNPMSATPAIDHLMAKGGAKAVPFASPPGKPQQGLCVRAPSVPSTTGRSQVG
jgi:hypothetical protein